MEPELFLDGPLETLPLATVCRSSASRFKGIVERVERRLNAEAPEPLNRDLYTAAFILAGLNRSPNIVRRWMKGLSAMKESSTYQLILEEGEKKGRMEGRMEGQLEQAQKSILLIGTKRLGQPSEEVRSAIHAISSQEVLDMMVSRLLEVESWDEILQR